MFSGGRLHSARATLACAGQQTSVNAKRSRNVSRRERHVKASDFISFDSYFHCTEAINVPLWVGKKDNIPFKKDLGMSDDKFRLIDQTQETSIFL